MRLSLKWMFPFLVLLLSGGGDDANAEFTEEEAILRAAFVYNFTRFTRWPEAAWREPGDSLNLCTSGGETGITKALQGLAGRMVKGHPIAIRALDPEHPGSCHVLYIAGVPTDPRVDPVASVQGKPVLTVGEAGVAFPEPIIRFFTSEKRLRFAIDLPQARRSGLAFSSRLLALAEVIE